MMPERHRLRGLQMREAGHDRLRMGERLLRQRALIIRQRRVEFVQHIAHPQPEIGRDLIVARARGMQPSGCRADHVREPRLDVHVDVFERALETEFTTRDF